MSHLGIATRTFAGFTNPILIDEMDVVIGGHARLIAAMELGLETVPTIRTTGLTDTEKKALRLADNAIALDASWDIELETCQVN